MPLFVCIFTFSVVPQRNYNRIDRYTKNRKYILFRIPLRPHFRPFQKGYSCCNPLPRRIYIPFGHFKNYWKTFTNQFFYNDTLNAHIRLLLAHAIMNTSTNPIKPNTIPHKRIKISLMIVFPFHLTTLVDLTQERGLNHR